MKTALLLSGHYRTFDTTSNFWKKNVIDQFCCNDHVYLSTYNTDGRRLNKEIDIRTQGSLNNALFDGTFLNLDKIKEKNIFKDIIFDDYQIIEQKENFKEKTKLIKNIIFKTFNQDRRMEWFFSLYYKKLDGLKNLIKKDLYDVVICSRPDYAPKSVFFNSETLDKEKIYLSRLNIENGYHDFFIIGSPQNLLKIFNIYHDINDILIPHVINLGKINEITCGHTLLTHYIDDILKLKENIVEIELNGELVR